MALQTTISLQNGSSVLFDLNAGIDLSNSLYSNGKIVDVFGLPTETKERLYSTDTTSVNVDKLSICCHNNRTHTESTKHIYPNGLNISECNTSNTVFGCILVSVEPISIYKLNDSHYKYECGATIDKYNELIITKSMIKNKIDEIKWNNKLKNIPSFFKQSIFVRVEDKSQDNKAINFNKNWPYLSNDAMEYLSDKISNVFGINLCSVDRMESPKVPNHRIWFQNDPKSTRLITEGLSIQKNISDGMYVLNLQLPSIANTDAVPTRPIIYRCSIQQSCKEQLREKLENDLPRTGYDSIWLFGYLFFFLVISEM